MKVEKKNEELNELTRFKVIIINYSKIKLQISVQSQRKKKNLTKSGRKFKVK